MQKRQDQLQDLQGKLEMISKQTAVQTLTEYQLISEMIKRAIKQQQKTIKPYKLCAANVDMYECVQRLALKLGEMGQPTQKQ